MTTRRKTPPKLIYLEFWPSGSGNTDTVHYGPIGYRIDLVSGATSQVYVYERVPAGKLNAKRKGST